MRSLATPVGRIGCGLAAIHLSTLVCLAALPAQAADKFHAVLIDKVETKSPIFIIGIEKRADNRARLPFVSRDCGPGEKCFAWGRPDPFDDIVRKRVKDRAPVVSHVVRIEKNRCEVIANAYGPTTCPAAVSTGLSPDTISGSWEALEDRLYEALEVEIARTKATHLVIMATGWATGQVDSIAHYDEWAAAIEKGMSSSPATFRPIFVGVTWPSTWGVPLVSFANKAHDADEIGYTWANVLVNRVAPRLKEKTGVRVVLLGHSFGSRMLTTAAYAAKGINESCADSGAPDLLVGLQGAFSVSRYVPSRGDEGSPYQGHGACEVRAAFTTSWKDRSLKLRPADVVARGSFIGTNKAFQTAPTEFLRVKASASGNIQAPSTLSQGGVLLIDAGEVVSAHNDVFDAEIGTLVADLITSYAPFAPGKSAAEVSFPERP